jgi:hypothetical protein
MTSTIKLRRSSTPGSVPTVAQLELGEVAINTHDGKMFFKRDQAGQLSIIEVGGGAVDNVLYVSENGDDVLNSGESLTSTLATLDEALNRASSGTTIFLKSGDYTIDNSAGGLDVPENVSIVGDNLRTTTIRGLVSSNDLLYVNNSVYITGVTFRGHTSGAAAVSFNPNGSAGAITTSPYIQNCSSITTTGVGMKIDGNYCSGLRSMVSDSFTQINEGGKGVYILNRGYAQLVSIFTVACEYGVLCEAGGQCSLTNSNCSFGTYGLVATGVSNILDQGQTTTNIEFFNPVVTVTNLTEAPKYGSAIRFSGDPKYYTVKATNQINASTYEITILEDFQVEHIAGIDVFLYERSLIQASSITFEYVGSGFPLNSALPENGGFPIQANEIVEDSDDRGQVYFTSTDHLGDFRIGQELVIERQSGTIQGTAFDRSLFAVLTPYILAIED